MSEAESRIKILRQQLNEYAYQYYVLDKPTIEDAVYDSLFGELKKLESAYPNLIAPDSPTQRVGGQPLDSFAKVKHNKRMFSLNDIFDSSEFQTWIDRIAKINPIVNQSKLWADIKMDGLACSLIYQDGYLLRAVTRGDGFVGEDVTNNIKTIKSIPLKLRGETIFGKGQTEIRGEIVMYKNDFEKLNAGLRKKNEKVYANPRNLAAGTIRQLDPTVVASRKLYFRAYDLLRDSPKEIPTQQFAYKTIFELGLLVNKEAKLVDNISQAIKFAKIWREKRLKLPFNTDGLVFKINDRLLYETLGVVGKNPRGAIAYKYPPKQATTKLLDIFISIGRTGAATPVAVLEPVIVAGSKVQMATLHNTEEIIRKGIKIGDTVVIHKAGDIIPEVVEPIIGLRSGGEKDFVMPKNCPECNTKFVKSNNEVIWRCPNNSCPARSLRHIQHFASKGAIDIEGLGEKNVEALLDSKLIKDTADLYTLKKKQLINLDRFAEVSAQNLVYAISIKTKPTLAKFIFALGIRQVGTQTAIDLANSFKTLDNLAKATVDELSVIDGVGVVVAESIVAWFADQENKQLLLKFKKYGVWPEDTKNLNGPLNGKSFAITGSLDSMSREAAADKIRSLGGTFQSSVGKSTNYLVVGSNVGVSKLINAQKLAIYQISEVELIDILKQ
ncbi:MAG: NAD-dependent DNA ligase LigA [Candidatus Saccharibacteria bacterium]